MAQNKTLARHTPSATGSKGEGFVQGHEIPQIEGRRMDTNFSQTQRRAATNIRGGKFMTLCVLLALATVIALVSQRTTNVAHAAPPGPVPSVDVPAPVNGLDAANRGIMNYILVHECVKETASQPDAATQGTLKYIQAHQAVSAPAAARDANTLGVNGYIGAHRGIPGR